MSPADASNHIRWAGHTLMLELSRCDLKRPLAAPALANAGCRAGQLQAVPAQTKVASKASYDYQPSGLIGQPQPLGDISDFDNTMERRVRFSRRRHGWPYRLDLLTACM